MKSLYLMLIVIAIAMLCFVSCSKSAGTKQIRMGIILPSIDHLPLSVAMEKQYIDKAKLEIISFTSGWEVQEAITAGKIDMAIMPFSYAWTAISKGYKLKILTCLERETDGIVALPKYKSINELDKRKIGLLRASTLEILMQYTASKYNITYEPVYFRTPTEMIAALKAEEVDAIVSYVPLIQKINNKYPVLYWFSETYPGHPCCDLVVSDEVMQSHVNDIAQIEEGLTKAIKDIKEPNEEIYKFIGRLYGLDAFQTVEALKHTRFDPTISEADKQFEQKTMQLYLKKDYLSKIPAISDVYVK